MPKFSGTSAEICLANEGKWRAGFDISGHCFLLIYLIMIIVEEVSVVCFYANNVSGGRNA